MSEVLEAVESSAVDTAVDSPEVTEVEQESPEVEAVDSDTQPEAVEHEAEETEQPQVKGKGPRIPAHLSSHLTEIQETNPQLYKEIKGLYFANQAFKQQFPGGLQEVQKLKQFVEKIGGEQKFQSIQEEAKLFGQIDQKFTNADPSLVDTLAQANPQSYSRLMPNFIERYAQLDQDGYGRTMSKVMMNTLNQAGVTNALYLVQQQLQSNPTEAARLLTDVQKWMQGVDQLANSQPVQPKQDPLEQQRQQLQQERSRLYNHSISQEVGLHRSNSVKTELNKYLNGKQITQAQAEIIEERVEREIKQILSKDADFNANLNRYYQAGDRNGVLKLMKSRIDTEMTDAVKKVYGALFAGLAPNKGKKAEPAKTSGKPQGKPAVPAGWVKISKQPKTDQVDRSHGKTTIEMLYKNRAILKDGRKVQWDS